MKACSGYVQLNLVWRGERFTARLSHGSACAAESVGTEAIGDAGCAVSAEQKGLKWCYCAETNNRESSKQ